MINSWSILIHLHPPLSSDKKEIILRQALDIVSFHP